MVFKFSEKSFSHCDFSAETSPPSGQNDAFLESCKLACSLLGNLDLDNLLCPPINPIDLLKSHFIFSTILRDYNTFAFEEKTCFPSIISKVLLRKSVMPPRLPPPQCQHSQLIITHNPNNTWKRRPLIRKVSFFWLGNMTAASCFGGRKQYTDLSFLWQTLLRSFFKHLQNQI